VRLDVRTLPLAVSQSSSCRVVAAAERCIRNVSDVFDRSCEDESVKPICVARSRTTRYIKRHRFAHSPPDAGHASPPTFARCSATGSSLRGLAG